MDIDSVWRIFANWLYTSAFDVGVTIVNQWGFLGVAFFCLPIIRRLIKVFKNTF